MRIRIDKADRAFSLYVRERDDWTCQGCGRIYDREESNALQCSHFWGRGNENTRFFPLNADAACFRCHQYWGSNPEEFRAWKYQRIGKDQYDRLKLSAHLNAKKDRKLAYMVWKKEYLDLCKRKGITPKKI